MVKPVDTAPRLPEICGAVSALCGLTVTARAVSMAGVAGRRYRQAPDVARRADVRLFKDTPAPSTGEEDHRDPPPSLSQARRRRRRQLSMMPRTLSSLLGAVGPEVSAALRRRFGDITAGASAMEDAERVSLWLASALRLQRCPRADGRAAGWAQVLGDGSGPRRRLWGTVDTAERASACMHIIKDAVTLLPDGRVDASSHHFALDHPAELFQLGQATPPVVRLLQSPEAAAGALVALLLAVCIRAAGWEWETARFAVTAEAAAAPGAP
jgi:hypothetical protein